MDPPPSVAQAYVNQRKLDQEVKTLQAQAAQFAKQTGQWITMVENFNQALKVGPPHPPDPLPPSQGVGSTLIPPPPLLSSSPTPPCRRLATWRTGRAASSWT